MKDYRLSTILMSNLWFFRLRGGNTANAQERRRSSSERVQLDLPQFQYHQPMSGQSSRLQSTRGSTSSYCGGGQGLPTQFGDVPPLLKKNLMPGTSINLADSLDNVAQLIPRSVKREIQ